MQQIFNFLSHQSQVEPHWVAQGALLHQKGQSCDWMPILLSGKIHLLRTEPDGKTSLLYEVDARQGCLLSAAALISNKPFPVDAKAQVDCEVLSIPKADFMHWIRNESVWQEFLFDLLIQGMDDLIERINLSSTDTLDKRIETWLQYHDEHPNVHVTHQQLADELSTSREVISRTLKKMERNGLLTIRRGLIKSHLNPVS